MKTDVTYKLLQVGTGGRGRTWCESILPPCVDRDLVEVVAAVDIDEPALENAQRALGLTLDQCYTDLERAFERHEVDCCTIVVPPHAHEDVVDAAIAHDAHILSEKPIADTLEAAIRIEEKVQRAGVKMGVTMSHRFDRDKTALRRELKRDRNGPLDYLVYRLTNEMRSYGDWASEHVHEMDDPLMISGAVHHLDILADLAGSKCKTAYAQTWNPDWGEYASDSQGMALLTFENGVKALYEGAKTNAAELNAVAHDYIRAECRDATLVLDDRELLRYPLGSSASHGRGDADAERIPLPDRELWTDSWLVEQFVDWLDGSDPMPTNVTDNLHSMATVFACIESSRTGEPVEITPFLEQRRDSVLDGMA